MSFRTAVAAPGPYAQRALGRCDELGQISEEPGRLTRRFATPALKDADATVLRWMEEAGMEARQDSVGNVVGRYAADVEDRPTLLLGSHLDSVRDAGRFDGPLGVIVALECVQRLHSEGRRLPFHVEVIGFADEEGVRYNTAYLGSKVVAGTFDPDYLDRADDDGITMREAIRSFGGDPERLADEARDPSQLLGYVEVHMEQGPVLEAEDLAVGVVSGIAGQSRISVGFTGVAGHAGTVPMGLRRDALAGAAEWLGTVEQRAQGDADLVATVGVIAAEPGASNVIPGRVRMTLDVRSGDDGRRTQARDDLRNAAKTIAGHRGLEADWEVVQETAAVACSPEFTSLLLEAVRDTGRPERSMPSGAGHDAAAIAAVTPVAMLFVRCAGGVSHNPAEAVAADDIEAAIDVLSMFLNRLAGAQ
jgi:hydantoinase/carbamoylase family amidase